MGERVHRATYALIVFLAAQVVIGTVLSSKVCSAPAVILQTIRGGQHLDYTSIVFQFEGRALCDTPVVHGKEVVFKLKNVKTDLASFRRYKSFDSWVNLEKAAPDLNVRIGLPEDFLRMSHFFMRNPDRLVINLYEKKNAFPPSPERMSSENSEATPLGVKEDLRAYGEVEEEVPESALAKGEEPEKNTAPLEAPVPEPVEETPKVAEQLTVDGLITLNFYEVDIRELLSALAMKREINIVMAQDATGQVSVHLYRVTLDEALDAITLAGGFSYIKQGGTYFIYKPKEEKDPQANRLEMRIFELKYAQADKVQEVLDVIPGKRLIKVHEPSKTIIVQDTPENIKKIESIIRVWDKMPKEVMIEAKILEVTLTDEMTLGVNWEQLLGGARIATGGFSTATSATAEGSSPVPTGGEGVFANVITGAGSWKQFTVALDALRAKTKVNTLSTPKILAIHGKQAKVQVGGQQGYKVTTLTGTGLATETVEFLDVGTILDITPYIDDHENVLLNVKPSINSVTVDAATGVPTVTSTAVSTWLLAKSGETVFIAGLIQDKQTRARSAVPCVGNIPGLGWLFRSTSRSIGKNELVVLITPQVLKNERKRIDQQAMEKTKKVEEELEKAPPPPYQEFLDLP